MGDIVKLIDTAPVPCGGNEQLGDWLTQWAAALGEGKYGDLRSLVLVIERTDGQVATITQTTGVFDGARVAGLLAYALHRKIDGAADIRDLREAPWES